MSLTLIFYIITFNYAELLFIFRLIRNSWFIKLQIKFLPNIWLRRLSLQIRLYLKAYMLTFVCILVPWDYLKYGIFLTICFSLLFIPTSIPTVVLLKVWFLIRVYFSIQTLQHFFYLISSFWQYLTLAQKLPYNYLFW